MARYVVQFVCYMASGTFDLRFQSESAARECYAEAALALKDFKPAFENDLLLPFSYEDDYEIAGACNLVNYCVLYKDLDAACQCEAESKALIQELREKHNLDHPMGIHG